jgi:ribosomal protein S18 acetylase RimI-like enzyme
VIGVRPARRGDATAIGRIHVETWRDSYAGLLPDRELLRMSTEIEGGRWERSLAGSEKVLVAEEEGTVIGFGSCGRCRIRTLPYDGEVYTLYVAPDFQGRGAGRALLTALFRDLAAAGLHSALIWVLKENQSRFFYEAMGGRYIAERDEVFWGVAVSEIAYGWDALTAPCSPR